MKSKTIRIHRFFLEFSLLAFRAMLESRTIVIWLMSGTAALVKQAWTYLWSHDTENWLYLPEGHGPVFHNFATERYE